MSSEGLWRAQWFAGLGCAAGQSRSRSLFLQQAVIHLNVLLRRKESLPLKCQKAETQFGGDTSMVYALNIDISLCHFPASEDVLRCVCAAIISHNVFSIIFELMSSPQRRSLKTCWQEISFCHKYTQR